MTTRTEGPRCPEWRPVLGYEGIYEVSSVGDVKRLGVPDAIGRPRRERPIRPLVGNVGYHTLSLGRNKHLRSARVHNLVADAFLGPRPAGMEVNHIDGDKLNNRVENLEYCSRTANQRHAVSLGLAPFGERHGMSKITAADVADIRRRASVGERPFQIAKLYPTISRGTVENIVARRTWRRA